MNLFQYYIKLTSLGSKTPLAVKILLFTCPHQSTNVVSRHSPLLRGTRVDTVLNSQGSNSRVGDVLRAVSQSKRLMSFLLTDTNRPILHSPLQDPAKGLRLFEPRTEEKHRDNLAWASCFLCIISPRAPKNHILPLISCRFSNLLS